MLSALKEEVEEEGEEEDAFVWSKTVPLWGHTQWMGDCAAGKHCCSIKRLYKYC